MSKSEESGIGDNEIRIAKKFKDISPLIFGVLLTILIISIIMIAWVSFKMLLLKIIITYVILIFILVSIYKANDAMIKEN